MEKTLKFRTLHADEIELRVGTVSENGASLLLYKDARCDQAVLDETVGTMNWQRCHSRDNANCTVSVWDEDKKMWVSKEDTGTESMTEKEKGLASDSFKRACTNWGIGRELYSSPWIFIPVPTRKKQNGGRGYELVNPYYFNGAKVSSIEYDDKRKITALTIVDKDGNEIFRHPKGRKSAPKKTAPKKEELKPKKQERELTLMPKEELTPQDMITVEQAEGVKGLLEDLDIDVAMFLKYVADKSKDSCDSVDAMTATQYDIAVNAINLKLKKMNEASK